MILIEATLPTDPEHREEARDLAADLAAASREEAGVIDYRVGADVEDPDTLRFLERYEDEAALDAHGETDHYQSFQGEIADLLAGYPEITRYDVDSVSDVEV